MGRNEKQKGTQIQFTIPGENNEHEGKMKWIVLNECLYIGYIDIWSRYLPDSVFRSPSFRKQGTVPFKINYCFKGRCEVGLNSGTTTFVTGDEIALDYGTSGDGKKAFFYPTAEYEGIEVIIVPSEKLSSEISVFGAEKTADNLIEKLSHRNEPVITVADKRVKRCVEEIKEDIQGDYDTNLLMADIIKLLLLLGDISFDADKRRTYCTPSQVDIAKKALEIITEDLSSRHTAAELAAKFGVSESSLKNYFRAVYGRGYNDMIREIRMKKAAELIISSKKSLGEIAEDVGYQNQSRFSDAFLKYHKVLPMEFKRRNFKEKIK